MTLKEFNESLNLFTIFFQIVPIYIGFRLWNKHVIIPLITLFILFTFFLDLFNFYQYKILKLDVGWLNNFYILNSAFWLMIFYGIILKEYFTFKIFFYSSTLFLLVYFIYEFLYKSTFIQFSSNCWLAIQLYIIMNSLFYLFIYFSFKKTDHLNEGLFYCNLALIVAFSLPTFGNVFQPYFKVHSYNFYIATFVIMNCTGIFYSIITIVGLLKFRKLELIK